MEKMEIKCMKMSTDLKCMRLKSSVINFLNDLIKIDVI